MRVRSPETASLVEADDEESVCRSDCAEAAASREVDSAVAVLSRSWRVEGVGVISGVGVEGA